MRLNSSFLATMVALTALAACGTKTPLSLPPQPATKAAAPTPAPAVDNSNKASTEPRQ